MKAHYVRTEIRPKEYRYLELQLDSKPYREFSMVAERLPMVDDVPVGKSIRTKTFAQHMMVRSVDAWVEIECRIQRYCADYSAAYEDVVVVESRGYWICIDWKEWEPKVRE